MATGSEINSIGLVVGGAFAAVALVTGGIGYGAYILATAVFAWSAVAAIGFAVASPFLLIIAVGIIGLIVQGIYELGLLIHNKINANKEAVIPEAANEQEVDHATSTSNMIQQLQADNNDSTIQPAEAVVSAAVQQSASTTEQAAQSDMTQDDENDNYNYGWM